MVDLGPLGPVDLDTGRSPARHDPRSPVFCDRCGCAADVTWCDVSTYAGRFQYIPFVMGSAVCPTAGCVDEDGSRQVPPPDVPGELTRDDRRWIRRQQQLADDLTLADRRLRQATMDL